MKKGCIFLVFLLILPIAFAEIEIKTSQPIYNLKNKIGVSASVLQGYAFEGLFKLTLNCDDYKLQYFLIPVNLEENFRTAIDVPELTATGSMLGKCFISGDLSTNDNSVIDKSSSDIFSVTHELNIIPINEKIAAFPGTEIEITGIVNEAFGNNVAKGTAKITLDENSYDISIDNGKFYSAVKLPPKIKSGKHEISIGASDPNGNSGSSSVELEITAVPNYIKIELSEDKIKPGSKVSMKSSLFDQADDIINAPLDLELTGASKNKVFTKVVQSNEPIDYEFSQYAEPGLYSLISSYENLITQQSINITSIRDVKIKYQNETVVIENIGNVPFKDELTFIIQNELKKYPITKSINIEPSKVLSIDLSKEVPFGIYDVLLIGKEGIETIQDAAKFAQENAEALLTGNDVKEKVLASSVEIEDNRPVYRKIGTGFSSVTNSIIGADGLLTRNPLIAPVVLFAIVLLIVFRYGRKPIMNLFSGRKKDEEKKE